jgi:hypothetical protein
MDRLKTKNYVAGADIPARTIVKFSADGVVVPAAAADDAMIGISAELDVVNGERVDVHLVGITEVVFGGAVARGGAITSDANGNAIAADAHPTGAQRIVGFALVAAAQGDVASVLIVQGVATQLDAVSTVVAAEAADGIDVACQVKDAFGVNIVGARQAIVRTLAVTADKGDLAVASAPVGTLKKAVNPATGPNIAWFETTAGGAFSFKVSDDQVEDVFVEIEVEGCRPRTFKVTFA